MNAAYETSLKSYSSLHDRHSPNIKCTYESDDIIKLWITKGWKNTLYSDFIKFRTKNAEETYKLCNNRFTMILRQAQTEHYNIKVKDK